MSTHRCPRCNTPVIIPSGRPGGICQKCRRAVLLTELKPEPEPSLIFLRMFLLFTVLASCGLLSFYVYQQTNGFTQTPGVGFFDQIRAYVNGTTANLFPQPDDSIQGEPHARNVWPRRFCLWEFHSSDEVRIVDIITEPDRKEQRLWVSGPSLRANDKILSEQIIGGSLIQRTMSDDYYGGFSYHRPNFYIRPTSDNVGYDMWVKKPPHLHIDGDNRLISLGIDPKSYRQEIIAVAIPADAQIMLIADYQPYRHIIISGWDIFYYDVSAIDEHVSIHIAYRPGGRASTLDWPTVEMRR